MDREINVAWWAYGAGKKNRDTIADCRRGDRTTSVENVQARQDLLMLPP